MERCLYKKDNFYTKDKKELKRILLRAFTTFYLKFTRIMSAFHVPICKEEVKVSRKLCVA